MRLRHIKTEAPNTRISFGFIYIYIMQTNIKVHQNDLPKEICIFIGFILAINGG